MNRRTVNAVLLALLAALGGCTVGPNYEKPPAAAPPSWSGLDAGATGPGVVSVPNAQAPDITAWWTQFNDATLTSLIERAAAANLTLAAAESRVRQARAQRTVAASGLYPTVDAAASYSRSRNGGAVGDRFVASTGNFFRAGFDAAWEIDVFGGTRRGVEAADAQIESAIADRFSLMVSLEGEIASTYLDLRGAQRQLAIARENLATQRDTLSLTQERFEAGFVSALDVATSKAQVSTTESQVPSYEAQARADIYALGVLLGQEPGVLLEELTPEAAAPKPPGTVPVGLPSTLLERRPDIKKAEADLHAATAQVGVAVADQYPKFTLTGSLGVQSNNGGSLGNLANRYWSITPGVLLPIFAGGRIDANIEVAREVADQALLAYRAAVLTALQDVETSLVKFTREQERRALLAESAAANREAVDLSLQLYSAGRTDFLNVLSAQRALYATEAALAQSDTTIGTNLVALYKALGGGWPRPAAPETAAAAPAETPGSEGR